MLRVLLNSDFFKEARFSKVKSPAELVCSTLRFMGDFDRPAPRMYDMALEIRYMGQDLMNPPTVEGWHTGKEWIDSGTLVERVNYAASEMGRLEAPGIRAVVRRFSDDGPTVSAGDLLEGCLEMLGGYQLMADTRNLLLDHLGDGPGHPHGRRGVYPDGGAGAAVDRFHPGVPVYLGASPSRTL